MTGYTVLVHGAQHREKKVKYNVFQSILMDVELKNFIS